MICDFPRYSPGLAIVFTQCEGAVWCDLLYQRTSRHAEAKVRRVCIFSIFGLRRFEGPGTKLSRREEEVVVWLTAEDVHWRFDGHDIPRTTIGQASLLRSPEQMVFWQPQCQE